MRKPTIEEITASGRLITIKVIRHPRFNQDAIVAIVSERDEPDREIPELGPILTPNDKPVNLALFSAMTAAAMDWARGQAKSQRFFAIDADPRRIAQEDRLDFLMLLLGLGADGFALVNKRMEK